MKRVIARIERVNIKMNWLYSVRSRLVRALAGKSTVIINARIEGRIIVSDNSYLDGVEMRRYRNTPDAQILVLDKEEFDAY